MVLINRRLPALLCGLLLLTGLCAPVAAYAADDEADFKPIFNGKDLEGWDGNPKFWSVKEGTITGTTTKENPTQGNTFLIWKDGTLDDFVVEWSAGRAPFGSWSAHLKSWLCGPGEITYDCI